MRICVVGHGLTPVSGHARGIFEVAAELAKKEVRIDLFTDVIDESGRRLVKTLSERYAFQFNLTESGEHGNLKPLLTNPVFEESLKMSALAHVFDVRALFFLRKNLKQKKIRLKTVYSVATFPKFDIQSLCSGPYTWLRLFDFHDRNFLMGLLFPPLLLPWIYSRADHILTSCHALKDYLLGLGVSKEKISVIYPPVNPTNFPPDHSREPPSPGKPFRIFYYGWISDIRGVSDVLKGFKQFFKHVPNAELIISNPDAKLSREAEILRRQILTARGTYPVQFLDYQLDLQQCLRDSDLVVLPFRGRFGYLHPPMTLIETILKEKVVLTRPLLSILEIVDEKELLIVKAEDVLEEKMRDVYNRYPHYQNAVEWCRKEMVRRLGFETVAGEYAALYEKIQRQESRYLAREVYSDGEVASTYDAVRFSSLGGKLFDRIEKKILMHNIPKNKDDQILEVGSGTGRFLIALGQKGYKRLYAADISEPLLRLARENAAMNHLTLDPVLGDIYHLPYAQDSFGAVYALRVLNQLGSDQNRSEAVAELFRLVRPGGVLVFDVINQMSLAWLKDPDQHTDLKYFKKNIRRLPGLKMVRVLHRMSLSQTLMEKSPGFLSWGVYGLDLLLSSVFPFLGTRVYFVIHKKKM